jgi:hypothetical protein
MVKGKPSDLKRNLIDGESICDSEVQRTASAVQASRFEIKDVSSRVANTGIVSKIVIRIRIARMLYVGGPRRREHFNADGV